MKREKPQMFKVEITRKEFLKLPIETRRRILKQQVKEFNVGVSIDNYADLED